MQDRRHSRDVFSDFSFRRTARHAPSYVLPTDGSCRTGRGGWHFACFFARPFCVQFSSLRGTQHGGVFRCVFRCVLREAINPCQLVLGIISSRRKADKILRWCRHRANQRLMRWGGERERGGRGTRQKRQKRRRTRDKKTKNNKGTAAEFQRAEKEEMLKVATSPPHRTCDRPRFRSGDATKTAHEMRAGASNAKRTRKTGQHDQNHNGRAKQRGQPPTTVMALNCIKNKTLRICCTGLGLGHRSKFSRALRSVTPPPHLTTSNSHRHRHTQAPRRTHTHTTHINSGTHTQSVTTTASRGRWSALVPPHFDAPSLQSPPPHTHPPQPTPRNHSSHVIPASHA